MQFQLGQADYQPDILDGSLEYNKANIEPLLVKNAQQQLQTSIQNPNAINDKKYMEDTEIN